MKTWFLGDIFFGLDQSLERNNVATVNYESVEESADASLSHRQAKKYVTLNSRVNKRSILSYNHSNSELLNDKRKLNQRFVRLLKLRETRCL